MNHHFIVLFINQNSLKCFGMYVLFCIFLFISFSFMLQNRNAFQNISQVYSPNIFLTLFNIVPLKNIPIPIKIMLAIIMNNPALIPRFARIIPSNIPITPKSRGYASRLDNARRQPIITRTIINKYLQFIITKFKSI